MKSFASAAAAAVAIGSLFFGAATAQSVDPIVIKGTKFFYKTNGTEFYIKGIAYQQDPTNDGAGSNSTGSSGSGSNTYTDPLADPSSCSRDLPYLIGLNTNTIRVYAIDPTKDHSECINMFANAGIYIIADLGSPDVSIDSNDPSWTTTIMQRYTDVIDSLANYTSVLGFFAGNEVITMPNTTDAAPFVKAAVRDTKAYIKSKPMRDIPVGYAAEDNQYVRDALAAYMDCGSNANDTVDFYGQNVYSWCGNSSFTEAGYNTRVQDYQNYSVPVFFSEYGCNTVQPRLFTETPVLYGPLMDGVFSGGIVYLYFQETNNYGLVSVDGSSVSTLQDYNNLKTEIATVSPTLLNSASYTASNSPRACPTGWANFSVNAAANLPPSPNAGLCNCMYESLSCVPSNDLSEESYGSLFGYVCGLSGNLCSGIAANGTTGTFGQYGMCNSTQQLGYVLNQYYSAQSSNPSACSFSGSAMTKASATPAGTCADALSSASAAASSGSSGSHGTSSKKGDAASISRLGSSSFGTVFAAIFVQIAVISGVCMVML